VRSQIATEKVARAPIIDPSLRKNAAGGAGCESQEVSGCQG
jgi:hypothetical protein